MIYFDNLKMAHSDCIPDPVCTIDDELWQECCYLTIGKDFDIINGNFVDLRQTEEYKSQKLIEAKTDKHAENIQKAKQAVENGYVTFKNAQIETNAQTVGDLTATMLMLQAQQNVILSISEESFGHTEASAEVSYTWLSKDDKAIELNLDDFITLGNLIASYKNTIWNEKYITFKSAIENAETLEELEGLEINYINNDLQAND